MKHTFTAAYKKSGDWYLAWLEEVPGVNTQGKTMAEARANLQEAARLIIETNRILTKPKKGERVRREALALSM